MKKHSGETDKIQKEKLTSSIEQVLWTRKTAAPGGKAGLIVTTQLVGKNSEVSIQISDKSGKNFDTVKKKMINNKLWIEVTVPEKAKEELIAEVKLSKHSLDKKSNGLYLFPVVEIKNLKWDKQEAKRGDTLKLTADIKGLADGNEAEIQIWEHDADQAHDLITKFPVTIKNQKVEAEWEFQYVDDTDDIPSQEESEKGYQWPEYFFRVVCEGKSVDSGLLKFKDWVEIKLKDQEGKPVKEAEYELQLPDGQKKSGKLDDSGYAKVEDIPPGKFLIQFKKIKGVGK